MVERNKTIDICKGIGIILMILGHSAYLTCNWSNMLFKVIFSFHMPLFVFFSGYFYVQKPISTSIKSNLRSLAVPYFLSSFVSLCIVACLAGLNSEYTFFVAKGMIVGSLGNKNSYISFWPLQAGAVWFLLSLCVCKIVFNWLYTYNRKHIIDLSVLLSFVFYIIGHYIINIPLCLGVGLTFLVFYAAGFKIREFGIESFGSRWILYLIWLFAVYYSKLNTSQYIYSCYPLNIIGAICGSIMLYDICHLINPESFIGVVMSFIGRHTLPVLCCHSVAFCTKNVVLSKIGYDVSNIVYDDVAYFVLTLLFLLLYAVISVVCKRKRTNA